jgi:hypothetical protein
MQILNRLQRINEERRRRRLRPLTENEARYYASTCPHPDDSAGMFGYLLALNTANPSTAMAAAPSFVAGGGDYSGGGASTSYGDNSTSDAGAGSGGGDGGGGGGGGSD